MTTTLTDHAATGAASETTLPTVALPTLGWALKRAMLGFAILFFAMGSIAVLMYASIDPDLDGAPRELNAKGLVMPISTTGATR